MKYRGARGSRPQYAYRGAPPSPPGHERGPKSFTPGLARLFEQLANRTNPAEALNELIAALDHFNADRV